MSNKKPPSERKMPHDRMPIPGPGRDPELTPEIQEIICAKILKGNYIETAVRSAGVHPATYYRWRKRTEPEFVAFREAVDTAFAKAEEKDVSILDLAIESGDLALAVKTAQWRLERKHPSRWGRTEKLEHTGKDGDPLTFTDFIQKLGKKRDDENEEG